MMYSKQHISPEGSSVELASSGLIFFEIQRHGSLDAPIAGSRFMV
ncbi:hypothetical protein [Paenibacillus sp. sgz302251]